MDRKKIAALTFDDGPGADTTPRVLDVLERYGVPAAFFVVGDNITPEGEEVMRRAVSLGCEIENHSRTHSDMTKFSAEEIVSEISFTSDAVEAAVGRRPRFFRPPYIAYNQLMFDSIDMTFIQGVGAEDWLDSVSAEERSRRILEQVRDGTVILLHDMKGNFRTADAIEMIIPALLDEGYELVTVSGLFERGGVVPRKNTIYTNVFDKD